MQTHYSSGPTRSTVPAAMSHRPLSRARRARAFVPVLLAVALLALPPAALAWGRLGHRLVGAMAESALTPAARAKVDALLAGEPEPSLAGVSTWPDEVRDTDAWKHTWRWHFVNFPRGGDCDYAPARDCPDGDCVVAAIDRQLAVLADASTPRERRVEALKFVVHFVGDIHQPLHAGYADDKGGNDFQINYRRRGSNLHTAWDSWILETESDDFDVWMQRLAAGPLPLSERDAVARNPPARWAEESCRIVREPGFYPPRALIGPSYFDAWRPLAEQRLRQAAARLAQALNRTLG